LPYTAKHHHEHQAGEDDSEKFDNRLISSHRSPRTHTSLVRVRPTAILYNFATTLAIKPRRQGKASPREGSTVPEVVEKGIGISYPIEKTTNRKGGHTDGERIPQGTGIDHVRARVLSISEMGHF
jgi:hypothetical protein